MKFGLHIPDFTWECGVDTLRGDLADVARVAEQAGFDRISVMDHLWKIGPVGPVEHAMLEAYTTLGYLAAKTERVQLLTVVTAVVYRQPGLLAKAVSTLDVLSGGRAMLGIGAAWNEEESRGSDCFSPTAERFEGLEEALQICKQMWSDDDGPYEGQHYQLGRTLNSPQPLAARGATMPTSKRPCSCASMSERTVTGLTRRSSTCVSSPSWASRSRTAEYPMRPRCGSSR